MSQSATPVKVPLVTEPMGILASLSAARNNVLSIIPQIATRQPMVSGRTGKRWHMVMAPGALKEMLLDRKEPPHLGMVAVFMSQVKPTSSSAIRWSRTTSLRQKVAAFGIKATRL